MKSIAILSTLHCKAEPVLVRVRFCNRLPRRGFSSREFSQFGSTCSVRAFVRLDPLLLTFGVACLSLRPRTKVVAVAPGLCVPWPISTSAQLLALRVCIAGAH
eukprot:3201213-Amphidinium_carterae.1